MARFFLWKNAELLQIKKCKILGIYYVNQTNHFDKMRNSYGVYHKKR